MIFSLFAAAAQAASSPLAATPTTFATVQAGFEAGSAALEAKNWNGAAAIFAALEPRVATSPRSLAIVHVREAQALYNLERNEEALSLLRQALPLLPASDASLADDRREGLREQAALEEILLDHPAAARSYQAMFDTAQSNAERLVALAGLMRTQMFTDPSAALAAGDRARALLAADGTVQPALAARFAELRGRILLNQKRYDEAQVELAAALKSFGGLTYRVDRDDISVRSDLAILASLQGKSDDARKYLAYTGAGRDDGLAALEPATLRLPDCGSEGLRPDDAGIVQFSISDDGHVGAVETVYSSRPEVALEFARAVNGWSWTPTAAKAMPPFYRIGMRLEIRCTTTGDGPSPSRLLEAPVRSWLADIPRAAFDALDAPLALSGPDLARARDELARREMANGGTSPMLVAPLLAIAASPQVDRKEALALRLRTVLIARDAKAPVAVRASLALGARTTLDGETPPHRRREPTAQEIYAALLGDPRVAADAPTLATLRLVEADGLIDLGHKEERAALLDAIVTDSRLDRQDPARTGALIRQANLRAQAGDVAAARAAFEATGLTGEQCSLVDVRPALAHSGASGGDFPREAMEWGFSGWVTSEFDIDAAGHTRGARAVLAYPPFVFGPSAVKIIDKSTYTQSYRPAGELGCTGSRQTVRYIR